MIDMIKLDTNTVVLYDIKGLPIQAGDLVRTYHYTGRKGKIYYLYHVISLQEHGLKMLPAEWADPNQNHNGGACYFDQQILNANSALIIAGHGLGDGQSFQSRERKKNDN